MKRRSLFSLALALAAAPVLAEDSMVIQIKRMSMETAVAIAKASVELATAPQFDRIIKNYDLDTALAEAVELVAAFIGTDKD